MPHSLTRTGDTMGTVPGSFPPPQHLAALLYFTQGEEGVASVSSKVPPLSETDSLGGHVPILPPQPPPALAEDTTPVNSFTGLYSSTGFDMLEILSKVANRTGVQVNIGPVDMSCAFSVVDARKVDFPIIYASYSFEVLTGYPCNKIIGRNCRFLQAPDGNVIQGSRRRYTDNSSVFHMKNNLLQGKEVQVSLINYKRGGRPFINLVTIVPISMEGNAITHFVGFQIDLVEQPNAILEKMQDGCYLVNYTQLSLPPYLSPGFLDRPLEEVLHTQATADHLPFPGTSEILDLVGKSADTESLTLPWNLLLLDNSNDFIHVLSLKGIFLYCSASSKAILEYQPEELVGQSLSKICHSSDLMPVLKEIKGASTSESGHVSLVYRARRKFSGNMWLEVQGRLFRNQENKGRRCVVLSAWVRPVYQLSREAYHLCRHSADSDEFWGKVSLEGIFLYTTAACRHIIGYDSSEMVGLSLYQLVRSNRTTALTRTLNQVATGTTVRIYQSLQRKDGQLVQVLATFFPGSGLDDSPTHFVIYQASVLADDQSLSSLSSTSSSAPSPQINQRATIDDNLFSLLSPTRDTPWQYELHQLRRVNQQLRGELKNLVENKCRKSQTKRRNIVSKTRGTDQSGDQAQCYLDHTDLPQPEDGESSASP
ncbi:hypothetical protein IWQ61_000432 [Dispira simplex]|nr:hypothetical protein IWQ61_000432 [Dispira simplex]